MACQVSSIAVAFLKLEEGTDAVSCVYRHHQDEGLGPGCQWLG